MTILLQDLRVNQELERDMQVLSLFCLFIIKLYFGSTYKTDTGMLEVHVSIKQVKIKTNEVYTIGKLTARHN